MHMIEVIDRIREELQGRKLEIGHTFAEVRSMVERSRHTVILVNTRKGEARAQFTITKQQALDALLTQEQSGGPPPSASMFADSLICLIGA
jgi:DeoR/GlpR family transcriptional regulator of sugar metabolism